mgnify:CR=1 FL=1
MSSKRKSAPPDSIALFLNEWQAQRPDLDPWPLGILGRVARISLYLQRHAQRWLAPLGLTWETFSMIAALRRAGPPFEQKPSDLLRLTRGRALADQAIALHFEEAAKLLGFLSKSDRALLDGLLSQMLLRLENGEE